MKSLPVFVAIFLGIFSIEGYALTLEEISPHFSTDTQIIWKAPTNSLPKMVWTYRKQPQVFSAIAVSNALLLAEFQLEPFPKSLTKPVTIWDNVMKGDPQPDYFSIEPNLGLLAFRRMRRYVAEGESAPDALVRRTWQYAEQLGLDKALLATGHVDANSTISLSRKVDGIAFNESLQGFCVRYGSHGEILDLSLSWPKLERVAQERVIGPQEIIRCIRAFKTPVFPVQDETNYFARVKALSTVKVLTIMNITALYVEGKYGEEPSSSEPERFVQPFAEVDAVADWGKTNALVRLGAPLIASDANRLLAPARR